MHFYVAVDISGVSSLGGVATPITMENYSYFPIVTMNGGMCNDNKVINVCTFMYRLTFRISRVWAELLFP